MEDETFSIEVLIFATILALYVLASYYINKYEFTFVHQSTVAIFLGFLTALFLKFVLQKDVTFSSDFFFSLLLPPIVFSVGYSINRSFFQHLLAIVFFGIISTLLAVSMQGGLLALFNSILFDNSLTGKDLLLVTIITCSSDPITALSLLKSNSNRLNAIVRGESVLNSAVVIILFQIVSKLDFPEGQIQGAIVLSILGGFAYVFLCSLLMGIAFGLGLSYLFKKVSSFTEHHIKEASLILLTGYVVYLLGEFLGLSGVMALFTTAIIFSRYGYSNLSNESRQGTMLAFDSIRYIFQAFIFAYLGASLLTMHLKWSALGMALVILCLIPIIRFLSVVALPLIFKLSGKPYPLAKSQRKFFWYTGLIRGIIAFALSLQIDSPNRSYMKTVCFMVVIFTTVVGSTFLNRFCQLIGLGDLGLMKTGEVKEQEREMQLMPSTKYGVIGGQQIKEKEASNSPNTERLQLFEDKYLKPIFVRQESPITDKHEKRESKNIEISP